MPPQFECPMTTMFSTLRCLTPYSTAAMTASYSPAFSAGGTIAATLLTTNKSPGLHPKTMAGSVLESQQAITIVLGLCE